MQTEIFTLCDAATVSDGKMNLLGVFDSLWAGSFPTQHSRCALAFKIRYDDSESGDRDLMFKIIDPDGRNVVPPFQMRMHLHAEEDRIATFMHILNIQGFPLPKPGEFFLDLIVDEDVICRKPLTVHLR